MRLFALASAACLLFALTVGPARASAAPPDFAQPDVDVMLSRAKGYPLFEVKTGIVVDANAQRSWKVLTDYNRLAEFVPNLSASQVVSSQGDERIVVQSGFARFLFIRQAVNLTLQVTEEPINAIDIRLVSGNMREYQARWELKPLEDGRTHIAYGGMIAPDFYVPTLFGATLMKRDLRNMLKAVKAEIERK
ncbi:SRPBCC family protein [Herbaspirillum sp. RV1423]|uniref:SRPBCC family protein n=1 Tax=Herbaspirillum sp. RV1423 TaxID=1443993 RepID=UPI0004BB71C0|nr:SRPBCC family protein [Herbaspirillum sp. RV1423]